MEIAGVKVISEITQEGLVALMVEWARAYPKRDSWTTPWASGSEVQAMRDLCLDALEAVGADGLGGCLLCQG